MADDSNWITNDQGQLTGVRWTTSKGDVSFVLADGRSLDMTAENQFVVRRAFKETLAHLAPTFEAMPSNQTDS